MNHISPATPAPKRALPAPLSVTDAAAAKISEILAREGNQGAIGLRIGVSTKGCSGKSYTFEAAFDARPGEDQVTEKGVTLLFSPMDMLYLIGTQIDWEETTLFEGFQFRNPNEKGRCGCGESFHV
jgi:iron-sulfur cluster assembly protein